MSHREPYRKRMAARASSAARRGEVGFSFGATRVRTMLKRLRLHLSTERFLAERRRDAIWQTGCETASLAIERLASRLCERSLDAFLRPQGAIRVLRPVVDRRRTRRAIVPSRTMGWRGASWRALVRRRAR